LKKELENTVYTLYRELENDPGLRKVSGLR
jgi:hypothetical protein